MAAARTFSRDYVGLADILAAARTFSRDYIGLTDISPAVRTFSCDYVGLADISPAVRTFSRDYVGLADITLAARTFSRDYVGLTDISHAVRAFSRDYVGLTDISHAVRVFPRDYVGLTDISHAVHAFSCDYVGLTDISHAVRAFSCDYVGLTDISHAVRAFPRDYVGLTDISPAVRAFSRDYVGLTDISPAVRTFSRDYVGLADISPAVRAFSCDYVGHADISHAVRVFPRDYVGLADILPAVRAFSCDYVGLADIALAVRVFSRNYVGLADISPALPRHKLGGYMMDPWNVYADDNVTVRATGSGSLDGLAFAIKDVFAIKGHTCSAGNPDWLRTHLPAEKHAAIVERLLCNGATLSGTTITDELMFSINGENAHYGTPVNPAAPERIPGGSSSGSAAAVAAKLADFAIGTDTGGSVRVPSSYCGIYGIRPTHGAVSTDGLIPLAPVFDTVGWMARDARIMLSIGQVLLRNGSHALDSEQSDYGESEAAAGLFRNGAPASSLGLSEYSEAEAAAKPHRNEEATSDSRLSDHTGSEATAELLCNGSPASDSRLPEYAEAEGATETLCNGAATSDFELSDYARAVDAPEMLLANTRRPTQDNESDFASPDSAHGFTRLLIAEDMWALADAPTKAALAHCLPALSELVAQGESVSVAGEHTSLNEWKDSFRIIQGYEIWREHGDWITQTRPSFGDDIAARFRWASTIAATATDLAAALAVQQAAIARMTSLLDKRTVLVAPTVPSVAPLKNGTGEDIELRRQMTFQLCCVAGLSGLPQVTMPIAGENGLPVGLSFLAARGQDLNLLRWLVAVSKRLPGR